MSSLNPGQKAFVGYTAKQIAQYNSGTYSLRTNRNVLPNDDYNSGISNTITKTFLDAANNALVSVTIDKDKKNFTIHKSGENIIINETQLSEELAELVTTSLRLRGNNNTVNANLFQSFDERKVLVYIFLKYPNIMNTFSTQQVYNHLSAATNVFDRDVSIQECKQYLNKTFKQGNLHWFPHMKIDIGNLILGVDLQPTGGRTKRTAKTNKTQLKRCAEKVVVKGQERQVYIGPRGGKYVKMQNKTISLAQLKK